VRVEAGDVILFPQGDPHVVSSAPGMRVPHVDRGVYFSPRPPQLPYAISVENHEIKAARLDGGGPKRSTIVCGVPALDARLFTPLLPPLPRMLPISGAPLGPDWGVASFRRAAVVESTRRRRGGEAVLEKMSEMLFVEVLRRHVDALPAEETGWLAG